MVDTKRIVASADGVPIHYEIHGQGGPGLVLIHGALCKRSQWVNQVNHFAPQRTVVAVDLAGHGESGTGRKSWSMRAFGEDVASVITDLDLKQVVLVGHSMGGSVILEAARLIPHRIVGLVGIDTFQAIDRDRTPEQFEEFLAPLRVDFASAAEREVRVRFMPTSDNAVLRVVLDDVASMRPDVGLAELEDLFSNDQEKRARKALREVKAPMVIIARDSRPFDVEAAQRYGIDVEFAAGTGHWVMMEAPGAVNSFLEKAVSRFTPASSSL